jgi:hypothetical protein
MALGFPNNLALNHEGRMLLLRSSVGWELDIVDEDGAPVLIPSGPVGTLVRPDVDWLLAEHRAGRLVDANEPYARLGGIRSEFLGLDRDACIARDPKSKWRHDWATAAIAAGIKRSAQGAAKFLGAEPPAAAGPRPSQRSLLRWIAMLREDPHRRIGTLVSTAGREAGQSQLPPRMDLIVHQLAAGYWTPEGDPHKLDVAARVVAEWDRLAADGATDIGDAPPSEECVRERINSLQNRTTYAGRHGEFAGKRYYQAKGEPVGAEHVLERVTLDGVVFKHVCLFSDDWDLPAAKMKGVFAMDWASSFVFPGAIFAGPFRPEVTVQALLGVMTPPKLTEEQIAEDPTRAECYGVLSILHPDNEKALLPPSMIPNLVNLFSAVELPKVYHSDAKAKHERFHRFLHECVSRLKGRVLGPCKGRDPRYDPLISADITRAQYAAIIEGARIAWNERAKESLGWRSPQQVLIEGLIARSARRLPQAEIERHLSRTVTVVATTNGVEFDGIRYRFNERGLEGTLDANVRRQRFSDRLEDTGRCGLTARVWDNDLDYIDLYDPGRREYQRLYSTEPDYTASLTRYEHKEWGRMMTAAKGGSASKTNRLRKRGEFLATVRAELPKRAFRARASGVAVLAQNDVRLASGKLGRSKGYGSLLTPQVPVIPIEPSGSGRADTPKAPLQAGRRGAHADPVVSNAHAGADPTYHVADRGAGLEQGDDEGRPTSIWDDARPDDDEDHEG